MQVNLLLPKNTHFFMGSALQSMLGVPFYSRRDICVIYAKGRQKSRPEKKWIDVEWMQDREWDTNGKIRIWTRLESALYIFLKTDIKSLEKKLIY